VIPLEDAEGKAMKQAPFKLLMAAAFCATSAISASAFAQAKPPPKPPAGKQPEVEDLGGEDEPPPPEEDKDKGKGAAGIGGAGDGGASFICEANPEACQTDKLIKDYSEKELKDSQVYAVQQIYALRNKRVELSPYWGVSLNDQFVSHPGPGLAINYYVTNVLAVGINFNYYQAFNSDATFNKEVRQSTRLAIPINQYSWGANLNFTYVPLYGKFAGFGDFIFHWDTYVVGGVGAMSTRPEAVIDPENRSFKYKPKVAFNAGIGLRVFFNRWLAAFLEVRDYIYNEALENTEVKRPAIAGLPTTGTAKDDSTWLGDSRLTNAVQAQFGISIFLPFTWTYKLPK
jgi:outer membrane beta-barrel protein